MPVTSPPSGLQGRSVNFLVPGTGGRPVDTQAALAVLLPEHLGDKVQMAQRLNAHNQGGTLRFDALNAPQRDCVETMSAKAWVQLDLYSQQHHGAPLGEVVIGDRIDIRSIAAGLGKLSAPFDLVVPASVVIDESLRLLLQNTQVRSIRHAEAEHEADARELPDSGESKTQPPGDIALTGVPFQAPQPTIDAAKDIAPTPPDTAAQGQCQAACTTLVHALNPGGAQITAQQITHAVNDLIVLSPRLPAGHVDRLLSGFLQCAVELNAPSLIQYFVHAVMSAHPGAADAARKEDLLKGWANPIVPMDWRADQVKLVGRRPTQPMLVRLIRDSRDHHAANSAWEEQASKGVGTLMTCVLESGLPAGSVRRILQSTSSLITGGGPGRPRRAEDLTSAQLALRAGRCRLACALVDAIKDAAIPIERKSLLYFDLKLNGDQLIEQLKRVAAQALWASVQLCALPAVHTAMLLARGDGAVLLKAGNTDCALRCAAGNLRVMDFIEVGTAAVMVCMSNHEIRELGTPIGTPQAGAPGYIYNVLADRLAARKPSQAT